MTEQQDSRDASESSNEVGEHLVLHGSAVELFGGAVVLLGRSRSGKSALALELMAFGGLLVSDDRVVLRADQDRLLAFAPPGNIHGIEARGIGLLAAETVRQSEVSLIVDLDIVEQDRLPPERTRDYMGIKVNLIHGGDNPRLAAPIVQFLKEGRLA